MGAPPALNKALLAFAACLSLGAFLLGMRSGLSSPTVSDERAEAKQDATRTPKLDSPTPFTELQALSALGTAAASGDAFRMHRIAAFLSKSLSDPGLVACLRQSKQFQGEHSNVAQLILALELAKRNPSALEPLLLDPKFFAETGFDTYIFFRYLAKTSPQLAAELASKLPPRYRDHALSGVINSGNTVARSLAQQAIEDIHDNRKETGVADIAEAIRNGTWRENREAFAQQFRLLMNTQPKAASALIDQIDEFAMKKQLLGSLFSHRWPSLDEALAAYQHHAANTPALSGQDRFVLITHLSRNAEPKDVGSLIDWTSRNMSRNEQNAFLQNAYNLVQKDPVSFLQSELFQNAPPSPNKSNQFANAIRALAASDLEAALRFAQSYQSSAGDPQGIAIALPFVFEQLGPEVTGELFDSMDYSTSRLSALTELGNRWAQTDPLAFLDWASVHAKADELDQVSRNIAYRWIEHDLQQAQAFSEALPEGETKKQYQVAIGRALSQQSPFEAFQYAEGIQNSDAKWQVISNASHQWNQFEPDVAAQYFNENYSIEESNASYLQSIVATSASRWAYSDPVSAVHYFYEQGQEQIRGNAISVGLNYWLNFDESAALQFFDSLESSPRNDPIFSHLSQNPSFARDYPELALKARLSITDPVHREAIRNSVEHATLPRQPW